MKTPRRRETRLALRIGVGLVWIAGATYNALWTFRHPEFFGVEGLAREASLSLYRWFFGDIVAQAPAFWTLLLILGELAIGVMTLGKGMWAKVGLWGSAVWSLWLFPLIWPYTIMMGPFALLSAWLVRGELRTSLVDLLWRPPATRTPDMLGGKGRGSW